MTWILVTASLTLLISFLCSVLEATLYSVTPAQLDVMQREKVLGARRFARYRERVEEPIAAILTVNTVANTFGSSLCGALVGDHFGSTAIGVFAAAFTLVVLVFSEILPKSIGVRYAPALVPFLAGPLQFLIWVSWPVARPARLLMSRMTGGTTIPGPSEEEVIALSQLAWRSGKLTAGELAWIENSLRLDLVSAYDLMTPRTVVQTLATDRRIGDLARETSTLRHSRFPVVADGDPDKVVGFVLRRDVVDAIASGQPSRTIGEITRTLQFVPDTMKGPALLQKLIKDKVHMVAVTDEYGGFEGIVTLEDVLEHLLGEEIVDEHDDHVDMQELARRRARGRMAPPAHIDRNQAAGVIKRTSGA